MTTSTSPIRKRPAPTAVSAVAAPPWTWWVVVVLAGLIALYGLAYIILTPRLYPPNLAPSFLARPWGILPHAFFGALALILGPLQFHRRVLMRRRPLHRTLGKLYLICSLLTGMVGLYMSVYAAEGPLAKLGFAGLAMTLLFCTSRAYALIRQGRIALHREWMIRSYALIFAAVMLRIELPLLIITFGDFGPAYRIVAWLSWVPTLLFANWYIDSTRISQGSAVRAIAETSTRK